MADFVLSAELSLKDSMSDPLTQATRIIQQLRANTTTANESIQRFSQSANQATNSLRNTTRASSDTGQVLSIVTREALRSSDSINHMGNTSYISANKSKAAMKLFATTMKVAIVAAASAATGAIAGIGVVAATTANEMQEQQNMLQAQLGLTKQQAEQLSGVSQQVFKNGWGADLKEVSDTIGLAKQQMKELSNTDLQNITQGAFTVRDAFGAEMNESIRTASVLTKQFGIGGQHAMDLITVGFQKGGNFSDELLDSLREYSVQFKQMGYNADEMLSILINGAQNGAFNLDKIGDSVKENFLRLSNMGKGEEESIKALGLNPAKIESEIAKGGENAKKAYATVMTKLASLKDKGKQIEIGTGIFGTQWEDLGGKVVMAMKPTVDVLGEVDGATKKAGESIQSGLMAKLTQLYRVVSTDLGNTFKPAINFAAKFVDKIIQSIPKIKATFNSVVASVKSFGSMLGSYLSPLFNTVMNLGREVFQKIAEWWKRDGGMIIQAAKNVVNFVISVFKFLEPVWKVVWFVIKAILVGVWDNIKGVIKGAIGIITNIVSIFGALFTGNWSKLWASIKGLVSSSLQFIWNLINLIFLGRLLAPVRAGMNFIRAVLMVGWNFIRGLFTRSVNGVWNTMRFFNTFYVNIFKTAFALARGIVSSGWKFIRGLFSKGWETLKTTTLKAIDTIKQHFTRFVENAKLAGQDFIDSLIKGIESKIDGVITACKKVWDAIVNFFAGEKEVQANVKVTPKENTGADGSHANGLDYVPFDGYRAILHKGERVLTAEENKAYAHGDVYNTSTSSTNTTTNKNSTVHVTVNYTNNDNFDIFMTNFKSALANT